jgi:quinate/shikimate dehydrogenase (NAD+)
MNDRSIGGTRGRLLLGLIGAGIQSSLTPAMHEREAAEQGLVCLYQLIDLEQLALSADALPDLLTAAEHMGFCGLNITHPCKQSVLPLLTDLTSDARALGAVNTVVLREGLRWGHNTDWLAFSESFRRGLPGAPVGRIVQIGAGGAGAATAYAMLKMDAGHITLVDLDPVRANALAARCSSLFGEHRVATSNDLAASLSAADGLIHATPTGMHGHPGSAVPFDLLRPDLWVAEVVYFPLETELLGAARAAGCRALDGSGMAVHQAVEAFRLFSGLEPDAERMRRHFVTMVQAR